MESPLVLWFIQEVPTFKLSRFHYFWEYIPKLEGNGKPIRVLYRR